MPLIKWDESIAMGIDEIDVQHKQLVTAVNELFDAMKIGKAKDAIDDVLKKIVHYTKEHFATEEKYFDQFGYLETEQHKKEHNDFIKEVNDFVKSLNEGKPTRSGSEVAITVDLWKFLKSWLEKHVTDTDRKYIATFKENGL
jgi:hemerythrin-like metal-binding protein